MKIDESISHQKTRKQLQITLKMLGLISCLSEKEKKKPEPKLPDQIEEKRNVICSSDKKTGRINPRLYNTYASSKHQR